ncbi:aKG-HExxH-type peptide beta-hydroxylase [Streptomyces sp. NPDC052301]|uniref:aKG-HExxH-type peptide beta-hydroxylase n=1 Tax=Streptomyces sp. NPDC052301 TaxID=3365687 RepID=UPI0037CFBF5A
MTESAVAVAHAVAFLVWQATAGDAPHAAGGEPPPKDTRHLYGVVSAALCDDSAWKQAEEQAASGVVSERTRRRLVDALDEAADDNPVLAAALGGEWGPPSRVPTPPAGTGVSIGGSVDIEASDSVVALSARDILMNPLVLPGPSWPQWDGPTPWGAHLGEAYDSRDTWQPLALPQQTVASTRLRGRRRLVSGIARGIERRTTGGDGGPGVWLLSGLGGCGKTTVALEVAHRFARTAGTRVWWVSGADAKDLSSTLYSVALDAGAERADFARRHAAEVLWRQLNALDDPWLLVLDNVDDPTVLKGGKAPMKDGVGWLRPPRRPNGAVLLTSRESRPHKWAPWVRIHTVDTLSSRVGATVLRDLAPHAGDDAQARALSDYLGGLPLALDLAGSYLARVRDDAYLAPDTPRTFAAYRQSFTERLDELAADSDASLDADNRARRAIRTTWELSLDFLQQQESDLARPLLRLLSCFSPAPIPHEDLLSPPILAASGVLPDPSHERIRQALNALAGLHLITVEQVGSDGAAHHADPSDATVYRQIHLHPLVLASSRAHPDFTTQAPQLSRLLAALLNRAILPLNSDNPEHWPLWRRLSPHAAASLGLLPADEADPDVIVACTEPTLRVGQYRNGLGLFDAAVADLEGVAALRQMRLGADHQATLAARLTLAWALRDSGRFHDSESEYRAVRESCRRTLPDNHPYLQSARGGRARALRELGRYDEAEEELRIVLAIRRRDPTTHPSAILRTEHDLATLTHRRGHFDKASAELRDIWARAATAANGHRAGYDADDANYLASGISLTAALRDAGRTDEAWTVAVKVVQDHLERLTADHPHTLVARHERARVARDQGDLDFALEEFTAIWQIVRDRLGETHSNTAASRHELATVLHLLGDLEAAAEHLQAVQDTVGPLLGEEHSYVLTVRHNLAAVRGASTRRPSRAMSLIDHEKEDPAVHPYAAEEGTDPDERSGPPTGSGAQDARTAQDPSAQRILERFTRPRISRGDSFGGGGGGYSWSYSASEPEGHRSVTYRPPSRFLPPRESCPPLPGPLPDAMIDVLAAGRADHIDVARLRGDQLAIRFFLLERILTLAGVRDHHPLLPASEALALLDKADRAARAVVDDLMLAPATGRWMSSLLRRLQGHEESAVPLWVDLGHLHCLAAAAGVRAGLSFACSIPVRDGIAALPSLGFADLAPARPAQAVVVARAGRGASVQADGMDVSILGPSPAWHAARRVEAHVDATPVELSAALDDIDPYRFSGPCTPPDRLTDAQAERWQDLAQGAWRVLTDLDLEHAEALATAITALTPGPRPAGAATTSLSSGDAFGGIVLSEPEVATALALTLTHEFRHMVLNAVIDSVPLYDETADDLLFYTPWRDDPRPFEGVLQGVFAYFGVAEFWWRMSGYAEGRALRHAQFELALWGAQAWSTFTELRSSPRFTTAGRRFLAAMAESAEAWRTEPDVPRDIAALAEDACTAHRARWRLHHLRIAPETVSSLTRAWLEGAVCPPHAGEPPVLRPDPAARSLNTDAVLLRAAALDPQGLPDKGDGHRDPGGVPEEVLRLTTEELGRDPQAHEPWLRLALAMRGSGPAAGPERDSAGARSLTHRPELVRAVHLSLRERTGTVPDPWALAEWLGAAIEPPRVDNPRVARPAASPEALEIRPRA